MSTNTISNIGLQVQSLANLLSQQTNLASLNEQLASGQKHDNLTNYDPTDAKNLMDFQNSVTQKQAYIAGMQTVSSRLSLYDQTMTDMENIASNAGELASSNQALDSSTVSQLHSQAQTYLKQLTDDLNQNIGGRYIYAGTRYTTAPVTDLSNGTTAPSIPYTATTSPALPSYDSQYAAVTINGTPSGSFTLGNSSIAWSALASGNVSSVNVGGTPTHVTVTGLTVPATTPAQLASNLQSTITQISSQITAFSGVSASVNGATVSVASGTTAPSVTPDAGGTTGETTWSNGSDGTTASTVSNSSGAYTKDTVTINNSFSTTYGVTSNDPAIQQLIAGLQFLNAATAPNVSASTYQTNMAQASSLLTAALPAIQSIHSTVASNTNIITSETSSQNADITNLQNQLTDIQQVDLTTVGTEINSLQTQLQASYSATAAVEQLSILKYL